jgi:uncharacterized membrane protein YcaP (DUF421 family)
VIAPDLFTLGVPVAEKVIRTIAVYAALTVLIRVFGKRDLAQLNSHDLVVMLLVSNVVQNAIIGADNSLWGGVLGAVTLFVVNAVAVRGLRRNATAERLFEGTPTVLVRDGRYDEAALRHEGIRRGDLERALRVQGADGVAEVAAATLRGRAPRRDRGCAEASGGAVAAAEARSPAPSCHCHGRSHSAAGRTAYVP